MVIPEFLLRICKDLDSIGGASEPRLEFLTNKDYLDGSRKKGNLKWFMKFYGTGIYYFFFHDILYKTDSKHTERQTF
jgi:hypothetical protein